MLYHTKDPFIVKSTWPKPEQEGFMPGTVKGAFHAPATPFLAPGMLLRGSGARPGTYAEKGLRIIREVPGFSCQIKKPIL